MSSAGSTPTSGIAGFLSGVSNPTTSSSSTQFPEWLQQALYSVGSAAGNLASQPYTQFQGPTVAAPSAQTTQAEQLAGSNVGAWQPTLSQAQSTVAGSAQPVTAGTVSQYLNPDENYITGALNQNLQQNILPGIQDKFVSAGQSRSPQEAQLTGQAIYGTQQAAGQALAGNYQGALNAALQEQGQQTTAGNTLGQLGALQSDLGAKDVGQLAASGSTQDQLAQTNLNAAQNQFYNQQQYPYQQLGFLSDILRGLPSNELGATQTTVANNPLLTGQSPLLSFAGALASGNAVGLARGGHVGAKRGALQQMRRFG